MSKPLVPVKDRPWFEHNIPLVTFFSRASTWWMVVMVLGTQWAIHWKHALWWTQLPGLPDGTPGEWVPITLYDWLGAFLTVPALVGVIMFVWSLVIHLFFRGTVDKDTHDGTTLADWADLSAHQRTILHVIIRVGFFIGICILCSSLAKGEEPNQVARWQAARLNPAFSIALDSAADLFARNVERYQRVTAMRQNGVPASVLFCLHQRESSGDFRCSLAQGDPLIRRSIHVPKGRIPYEDPPYTWERCAIDAVYNVDRLDLKDWKSIQGALSAITSYNGTGYDKYHPEVPTPYLWSGTNLYQRGKYTGDGHFDRNARDKQLGVAAILLRLRQRGVLLPWE